MKSSRLVSILLLLQTRGRLTAAQLAEELEVSVRTVYRDVEALSSAGVPLYGDAGHAGGYRLLDGYRTRLTGLTTEEAEALFLAGVPGPAAELGLGAVLAAAQLKVRAALPPELREHADRVSGRFHLDAPGWYADADATPYLPAVADAVWNSRVLHVRYRRWREPTDVERRLEPYGLVLKAGLWYLCARVSGTEAFRVYRIDRFTAVEPGAERFRREDGFDLPGFWAERAEEFARSILRAEIAVRLSPDGVRRLPYVLDPATAKEALGASGVPDGRGWVGLTLLMESEDVARAQLRGLGPEVEVLAPASLRERCAEDAARSAALYR
ncbi:helix-turn-helix transcriptional regulator [Streptomyces sp. NPDC127574]|uniref:helix-turn-helix transcriptional regulator n=1 Tax=Streptomyces sp. NPDC127574 TaxID=3345401 RepID=UPI00362F8114